MKTKMKTGGMVNPNAKLQATKTASSKGVKSGVNPKAAASKVAKGRSGGTSVAPKAAMPKVMGSTKKYQDGGAFENFANGQRRMGAAVNSVYNKVTGKYPAKVYNEQYNKAMGKGKYSKLSSKELTDQYKQNKPNAISTGVKKSSTTKMQDGGPTGNSPENQIKRSMIKSAFNNAKNTTKARSGKPAGKI